MIRNIEKRKELQKLVYDRYTAGAYELTKEEKDALDGEVGAALQAYQRALENIVQIITDAADNDEVVKNIRDFIILQLNGKNPHSPFKFEEQLSTSMKEYIRTTVKEEMLNNGCEKEDADVFIEAFISYPSTRQKFIEEWKLKSIRLCNQCGKLIVSGYLVENIRIYCSDECVLAAEKWIDGENDLRGQLSFADNEDALIWYETWGKI